MKTGMPFLPISNQTIRLSDPARADLAEIEAYTLEHWGEQQKTRYLAQLRKTMQNLPASPDIGVARDDIAPGIRACRVGSHVVLYTATESGVEIARVLHQRMDISRHFG